MAPHKLPPVNLIRRLLMFNDWVPRRIRFWTIILFAIIYQFAGGVYLASLSQMVGETGLLSEDFSMANSCTLIGLTIVFPMLFRIKFRFFTRQLFFITSIGLIICNVLCIYIEVNWVLWLICFIAGFLKMAGMFGCMSSIQLNITPTRNFGVFFPVVYILVCGSIQLSGICSAYIAYFTNWRMMNVIMIAALILLDAIVFFTMKKDHRSGPYMPLNGVDFIGLSLWSALLIVGTWIFTFGEYYDWWCGTQIPVATAIFIVLLFLCIFESWKKKEPYIALKAFTYPRVINLMILLLGVAVMQSATHLLQPIYITSILNYDTLNVISLNIPEFIGIVFGALFAYYSIVRWKWSVKQYLFLVFILITYYEVSMYFIIDTETNKEALYLPLIALGFAEVMMESIATYYLSQAIPFVHFFQTIAIIGFIRAGMGTALASAIVHRLFNWSIAKSFMFTSSNIDGTIPFSGELSTILSSQSIMLALKECYGYLILIGIICLVIVLLSNYKTTLRRLLPRIISVRSWLGNRLKQDPTTI